MAQALGAEAEAKVISRPATELWGKAVLEELVLALGHLAHAEQHLLDIDTAMGKPVVAALVDRVRGYRKVLGEVLFSIVGVEEKGDENLKKRVEGFWCTLKHLSIALIHCDEIAERLIKKLGEALRSNNGEEAKKLLESLVKVYSTRKSILEDISNLFTSIPREIEIIPETRCREDLCLEEQQK